LTFPQVYPRGRLIQILLSENVKVHHEPAFSCTLVVQPSHGFVFSHEAHLTSLTIQSASGIFMIAIYQPAAHKIDTIFALL